MADVSHVVWGLLAILALVFANGFFVAAEFALVASKRYRLEQAALSGSRAARAALAGSRELNLMLAGAQLGITACTLGLGALAEPAIEHLLDPALSAVGLPHSASRVIAFVVSLVVVSFLHVVIGEMAPKSWAISNPERSALLLALPFRGFAALFRPVLSAMQHSANAVVRAAGVEPGDTAAAAAHGPAELRLLLEQSRQEGLLDPDQHQLLSRMLSLARTSLEQVMTPLDQLAMVGATDPAGAVEAACLAAGRSRLGVVDDSGTVRGWVHVREVVKATTAGRPMSAVELMSPPITLDSSLNVAAAAARMRAARAQLALVATDGRPDGFVALEDLLEQIIGEFYDETDPAPPA
jgi:CBS domain containing-hemolysin-like protein